MGSGRLREFLLSNRNEVRAGYQALKHQLNLPLPIQNVMRWIYINLLISLNIFSNLSNVSSEK